eukprot:scaffold5182_cov376-Prasinococcus_capsulatus_cf.AAC.1
METTEEHRKELRGHGMLHRNKPSLTAAARRPRLAAVHANSRKLREGRQKGRVELCVVRQSPIRTRVVAGRSLSRAPGCACVP